jgi:hypothetical protein
MHRPAHDPSLLTTRCQDAIDKLDDVLGKPARGVGQEVDHIETLIVHMRDQVIARLRQDATSGDTPRRRLSLERLNAVLSLLIGVEYPATGIQCSAIQQARDTLAQMLAEGLPS